MTRQPSKTLVQTYPDGHQLLKDRWQWILSHPTTCANAKRGVASWDYAKETYLTTFPALQQELDGCHLPLA